MKSFWEGITGKSLKAFAVANAPAITAGALALGLAVLAGFQGCALKETRKQLDTKERSIESLTDESKSASDRVLQLQEKLKLSELRSTQLSEQLDHARKTVDEPVFGSDGKLALLPDGTPVFRRTDEVADKTVREEVDVYQLRLAAEAQAKEEWQQLAETRRQAYAESQAELHRLEQSKPRARPWSAYIGPEVGGQDAGTWWATLGWKAATGAIDIGARASYPVAPAGALIGATGGNGPGSLPFDQRPFLLQFGADF